MRARHIACDLDGTLAHYDKWHGIDHIGEPIAGTVRAVRSALAAGHSVSIFTARVAPFEGRDDGEEAARHIRLWCAKHIGVELPVTAIKYGWFDEFWDDKAVHVVKNDGCALDAFGGSLWESCDS